MKNNKVFKIIIIIMAFIVIFALFIVITIYRLKSSKLSYEKATLVVEEKQNNTKEETTEIQEKNIYSNSIVTRNLMNNKWNRIGVNLSGDYEKDDDGNYYYSEYTLATIDGTYVRNIIFNKNYEKEVIGGLKVGASYDEIIETIGFEPPYKDEDLNLYGYKTDNVYAFFSDDEISIYPNTSFNNNNFENDLFQYLSGISDLDQTRFIVKIRNSYSDFYAKSDGEDVILMSENRQVAIRLNENRATEVTIYNGYKKGDLMESGISNYNIKEEKTDLVFLTETERIKAK